MNTGKSQNSIFGTGEAISFVRFCLPALRPDWVLFVFVILVVGLPIPATADEPAVPPLPETPNPALPFAKRDVEQTRKRLQELTVVANKATKKLADVQKAVLAAKTAQATAIKQVATAVAAIPKATASKIALDKELAASKATSKKLESLLTTSNKAATTAKTNAIAAAKKLEAVVQAQVTLLEKQLKIPNEKSSTKAATTVDTSLLKKAILDAATAIKTAETAKAAVDKTVATAAQALAKLQADIAAQKKMVVTKTKATQAAAAALTKATSDKKTADVAKVTADKRVTTATAAVKPLTAAKAAADKPLAVAKKDADRAVEKLALYEKSIPQSVPQNARLLKTLSHNRPFYSLKFDKSGEHVFAGAQDNFMHRWNIATGNRTEMKGHKSWIRRFDIDPTGKTLVSGAYEGKLIWWDMLAAQPTPLRTIDAHKGFVRGVDISPDGKYIVTCGNDNLVKVWSAADGKLIKELPGHQRHVYNVRFHPDGKFFVSGDLMGKLKQWETGTWKLLCDFEAKDLSKYDKTFHADIGGFRSMDFSPDGKYLAVAGISGVSNAFAGVGIPTVVLFECQTGNCKQVRVMKPSGKYSGTCWGVRFHPSGEYLVGGGSGNSLWFWRVTDGQSFFNFKLPNVAYALDFHPDTMQMAVALYDKTIRIYDLGPKTPTELKAEEAVRQAAAKKAAAAAAKKKKKK